MDHTTGDEIGNPGHPGRWCDWCGEAIAGDAHLHDGELVCPTCWPALQAHEERAAAEEAEAELERIEEERERAEAEYEQAVAGLREQERTWRRRADHARREVRRLEDLMRAGGGSRVEGGGIGSPFPPHSTLHPLPVAGGAPWEPSEEDWEDYREWAAQLDREVEEIAEGGGPEAPYGYE